MFRTPPKTCTADANAIGQATAIHHEEVHAVRGHSSTKQGAHATRAGHCQEAYITTYLRSELPRKGVPRKTFNCMHQMGRDCRKEEHLYMGS